MSDPSLDDVVIRPSFEQLNATLFSRGYLRIPLNISGLAQESIDALGDALHAIISQREEDLAVRTALTAKTRTLTASLERTKRFWSEETERCADAERKNEASKAKLKTISSSLAAEQQAHKATKEALNKTRRDLALIKASALQHRAVSDRSVARVRARIGEVTASALRSSVPDFRIVSSAFEEFDGTGKKTSSLAEQQVEELEKKRAELMDYNQALKRLTTQAVNAIKMADNELLEIIEAEEEDASSSSTSRRANGQVYQRDLFPSLHPLTTTSPASHPAISTLNSTCASFSSHVQTLLDLRTSRRALERQARQANLVESRETEWQSALESRMASDLSKPTNTSQLEAKITDLVKRLSVAEESVARKERKLKERISTDEVQVEKQQAEQERKRYHHLIEMLEKERKELEMTKVQVNESKRENTEKKPTATVVVRRLEGENPELDAIFGGGNRRRSASISGGTLGESSSATPASGSRKSQASFKGSEKEPSSSKASSSRKSDPAFDKTSPSSLPSRKRKGAPTISSDPPLQRRRPTALPDPVITKRRPSTRERLLSKPLSTSTNTRS